MKKTPSPAAQHQKSCRNGYDIEVSFEDSDEMMKLLGGMADMSHVYVVEVTPPLASSCNVKSVSDKQCYDVDLKHTVVDDMMMDDGQCYVTGLQIDTAKYGRKRFVSFFNLEFDTGIRKF